MDALINYYQAYGKDLLMPVGVASFLLFMGIWTFGIASKGDNGKSKVPLMVYNIIFVSLVPLVTGIVLAERTIHLYVSGVETSGTIVEIYQESTVTNHGTRYMNRSHQRKLKRYAVVKFRTQTGNTEFIRQQVKLYTSLSKGESVRVIYLPADPARAAIRGEFNSDLVFIPCILILVGSMFFGIGIGIWAKRVNINKRLKKRVETAAMLFILTSLAAGFIGVPLLFLYSFLDTRAPLYYNKLYRFMGKEETIYTPLVAEGIEVKKPHYGNPDDACQPGMVIRSLSQTVASSGDRIEMHGSWGDFTSDKVPQLHGQNYVRRLRVIGWTPEIVTVEIPDWIKDGSYGVGINCYMDASHGTTRSSGYLHIEID